MPARPIGASLLDTTMSEEQDTLTVGPVAWRVSDQGWLSVCLSLGD